MSAHPDEPLPTSCPTPSAQQSRNAPKTGQRSRFLHILGGDCCSRANRLRVSNPKISERPQRSPAQPATAPNKNTPGRSDRGRSENMERETGFAGQPCWPSACDCVAANRRPSAWEAVDLSVSERTWTYQLLGRKRLFSEPDTQWYILKQVDSGSRCGRRCGRGALPYNGQRIGISKAHSTSFAMSGTG